MAFCPARSPMEGDRYELVASIVYVYPLAAYEEWSLKNNMLRGYIYHQQALVRDVAAEVGISYLEIVFALARSVALATNEFPELAATIAIPESVRLALEARREGQ